MTQPKSKLHFFPAIICNAANLPRLRENAIERKWDMDNGVWLDTSNIQKLPIGNVAVAEWLDRMESHCRLKRITHFMIALETKPVETQVNLLWLAEQLNQRLRHAGIAKLKIIRISV